jgi:fibronectin-binding autotransporter adhesin
MRFISLSKSLRRSIATVAGLVLLSVSARSQAATVTLIASDALNTTSFNTALNWSNSAAPGPGNTYYTSDFVLRTPDVNGSFTFAGDSLSVDAGGILGMKGDSAGGTITINNLTFNGGSVESYKGGLVWSLSGANMLLAQTSVINLLQPTGSITVASPVGGAAGADLTVTGGSAGGSIIFAAANTYSGNTDLNEYTLQLSNNNALQNSTLMISSGGSLSFSGISSALLGGLSDAGAGNTANIVLQNSASAALALTVGNNNASTTYSGALSGSGSLTKIGDSTLYLSGNNVYTGGTTVSSGTLTLAGGPVFNVGIIHGTATVMNGATLILDHSSGAWPVSSNDTIDVNGGGTLALRGGDLGYAANVILNSFGGAAAGVIALDANSFLRMGYQADGLIQSTGTIANNWSAGLALVNGGDHTVTIDTISLNTLNFGGVISDFPGYSGTVLQKSGGGTLVLSGANTFSGGTNFGTRTTDSGVVSLTNSAALGTGTCTLTSNLSLGGYTGLWLSNNITVANPFTTTGTVSDLALDGMIRSVSGTNSITGTITMVAGGGNTAVQVDAGSALTLMNVTSAASGRSLLLLGAGVGTVAGVISDDGSNPVGVQIGGQGPSSGSTWTLSNSNTYTGTTTIDAGRLTVNGSLASPVTVNTGGTLGGTGNLTSIVVNPGGCLAPGDAPGVLTLDGNLTLESSAMMDFELDTPLTSDMISVSAGTLILNGQQFSDFDFTWTSNFGPGSYPLIDAGLVNGSLGNSYSGTIDGYPATLAVQGDNELVLTVTPEPSTLTLLAAGAIALIGYGSRRRLSPTTGPRGPRRAE